MCDETHLSDDFYKELAAITTRLRDDLTGNQYGVFRHFLRDKDLVRANLHLKQVAKLWDKTSQSPLGHLHDDRYKQFVAVVERWQQLMQRNGGPKRAAKLAKKAGKKLPAARPTPFAPAQRAR